MRCLPWPITFRKSPTAAATHRRWTSAAVFRAVGMPKADRQRRRSRGLGDAPTSCPSTPARRLPPDATCIWPSRWRWTCLALLIEASGKQATQKQRCFLVDYQMPTDPINIEVVQRIWDGGLGKVEWLATFGFTGPFADPPLTATIESRLQHLVWVNDVALGCDYIGNFDIHAIDAALWIARQRPVAAAGGSRIARPEPHGDARGVCSVVFEFADGLVLNHSGQALRNNSEGMLLCQAYGQDANAQVNHRGRAFVRGGPNILAAARCKICIRPAPNGISPRSTRASSATVSRIPRCSDPSTAY